MTRLPKVAEDWLDECIGFIYPVEDGFCVETPEDTMTMTEAELIEFCEYDLHCMREFDKEYEHEELN